MENKALPSAVASYFSLGKERKKRVKNAITAATGHTVLIRVK